MTNTYEKKCPSCQTPVDLLQLSAISLPIEQATLPWLRIMNKQAGNSVRTFGMSSLNELQLLAFTFVCQNCGHISWWDLKTDELEGIFNDKDHKIKLRWASNPDQLRKTIDSLTDQKMKAPFERLLHDITNKDGEKNAE